MKTFRELMEIVAPDVKTDIRSLDATSFAKKHGKTKTEIKNTFESAEEKVPEPGREAVGGRFTSRPPKSVIKPAPQVTSEEIEGIDEMDKSQTPPGRDGGEQFPPGPKVSKKTIKAVQKDPAKHLLDLFAKQYAKKKMKEEAELDEAVNEKQIKKDIDSGMSHDAVIGKHANKKLSNTDEIRKVIQRHAWNKRMKKEQVEQIEEGRPSQRHPLEGHEYHKKTDAELVYIAKDAHKAAEAMKGHNTTAENKYRDQANDSATVRYFRQKSGMPDWYKKKYGHMKEEVEQIQEIHTPGTKVKVPHKGKMMPGKVVRYDSGKGGYSPAYVVDIGEYESKTVPVHQVRKEEVMVEISSNTLKSYQQKVSNDAMKHKMDPTKRSPEKANRSISGFSKAQKRLEKGMAEGAPDLLKKEMPLHRHAEKLVAQNGVSKNDPDYHHHLGNTIKHLRMFGNIDLINKQDVKEEVMVEGGQDNAGGQYYDIKNSDGTIGMGYKPGKHYPSSSSRIEIKSEPKHPLHGKQVTNGKVTGKLIGTEMQGQAAKIKHSSGMIHHVDAKEIRKADMKEEAKDPKEYGYEGDMAMNQLQTIMRHAEYLMDMMKPDTDLPEWVQSKITLAADYIQTSCDYMTSEMKEEVEQIDEDMTKDVQKTKDGGYWSKGTKTATHYSGKKTYEYKKFDKEGKETGERHYRDAQGNYMGEAVEPPFTPNKPKTSSVAGKFGKGYSTARHLARMAMQKQVDKLKKPVKESMEESRKAEIVKDIVKKKKAASEDTFQKDPELSSSLTKTQ